MAKKAPVQKNILDRAIESVFPSWGVKRAHSRTILALQGGGGYTGASRSRPSLTNFNPGANDAESDINLGLEQLRGRSRDLARNAPVAGGALNTRVTHEVGTGLSMHPSIDQEFLGLTDEETEALQVALKREFNFWFESNECDITREQNGYGLQELVRRSMLESGDILCPLVYAEKNKSYKLAIQLVEADRIANPDKQKNTDRLVDGVVLDDAGAAIAYWVSKTHPGAARKGKMEFVKLNAYSASGRRVVLHLFERRRPGQHRGIPYLASVIEPLKQIDRWTEAELTAAVTNAVHAMFIRMDPEAFGDLFSQDSQDKYLESALKWNGELPQMDLGSPGKVINLLPGEEPISPGNDRPNPNFDPFFMAMITQISVSLEIPRDVLLKLYNNSYTAARASMLDAWRVFRKGRDFLATYFCQPIYEMWLDEAVASGRINAPGYFADDRVRHAYSRAVWVGDGPGAIDPVKEITAAKMRIEEEVSTRDAESIMYDGVPWEIKHKQRVKEQRMRREGGLMEEKQPAAAEPSVPEPDDTEDGDPKNKRDD
jgi:lambda family phage portal protein